MSGIILFYFISFIITLTKSDFAEILEAFVNETPDGFTVTEMIKNGETCHCRVPSVPASSSSSSIPFFTIPFLSSASAVNPTTAGTTAAQTTTATTRTSSASAGTTSAPTTTTAGATTASPPGATSAASAVFAGSVG